MKADKSIDQTNLLYVRRLTVFCVLVHLIFSLVGWNHSILDHHGFRQSQTAITSYYFIKDGFKLAYETPVLGVPWEVPFEFPLYQAVVAWLAKSTAWPLDATGRVVSLFFFYALLFVLYQLIRRLSGNKLYGYLAVALTLVCPTYLLWSRAFLIESTALFFCLLYLLAIVGTLQEARGLWMALAVFAGILGALVKITTFVLALALAGALGLMWWIEKKDLIFSRKVMTDALLMILFFAVIPMAVALKWTAYSDLVKAQNPFGLDMVSGCLTQWIFGTFQQRLTGQFHHVPVSLLAAGAIIIFSILCLLSGKQRQRFIMFFVIFLLGPLIFSNLFIRHGYYWYANTIYLTAALAFVLGSLLINPASALLTRRILIPGFFGLILAAYAFFVLPGEIHDGGAAMVASAKMTAEHMTDKGILLCYGLDWDASFPYYAKRRALMVSQEYINSPVEKRALQLTGENHIQALVIGPLTSQPMAFFEKIALRLHLSRQLSLPDKTLRIFVRY